MNHNNFLVTSGDEPAIPKEVQVNLVNHLTKFLCGVCPILLSCDEDALRQICNEEVNWNVLVKFCTQNDVNSLIIGCVADSNNSQQSKLISLDC